MKAWYLGLLGALVLLTGESHVSRKSPTMIPNVQPKPVLNTGDPRIEAVARAICQAKGIDPDHVGPPFPEGPLWEFFIPDAALFIKEYDAAKPH
jgi:hypothetical protein